MDAGYTPKVLKNLVEICAEMGVGRETVMKWIDLGAPIAVEYIGKSPRYSCEARELQAWRIKNARGASYE